ncbi:LysR family transcriptional regulator [Streptomyces reniochalinae]|uniref:LysR family transcriptional regulator n=2 Tax=Streptomyces reniochalinae TaxID=2250578 RepID=A0A367E9W2_9ACTN|nr:LysR family transcriptional regulator [Streptomyces reniochalinae]
MNDRMLRAFVTCARTGSVTRTATELGYSAASISDQIRQLEVHTQQPLFRRTPGGMSLTETGRRMVPVAHDILCRMDLLCRTRPSSRHACRAHAGERPEPMRKAGAA